MHSSSSTQPVDCHTGLLSKREGDISGTYQTIPYDQEASHELGFDKDESKSSSFSAFLHIICVVIGTGILQLPYAIKEAGWFSLVGIVLCGFLVYHSGRFLNLCLYHGSRRKNGAMDVGGDAFGTIGRRVVEFSFSTFIIGSCGIYLILAANNIMLMDEWTGLSRREWVFICMLLGCVPFVAIKTLKEASILSLFGVLSTVIMVLVIIVSALSDFTKPPSPDRVPPVTVLTEYQWISWSALPLSLASISFSFAGNMVFPHVEHSLAHPKSWNSILRWSFLFITITYLLIAVVGYLAYGDATVSPIFNNLQPNVYVTIAIAMLTLHVIVAIPINLTSFALDAEHSLGFNSDQLTPFQQDLYRILFRIALSLLTLTLAITVPFFDHVVALLGALSNSLLVFILPPACYLSLYGWDSTSLKDRLLSVTMITLGIFVLFIGSSQAFYALYLDFTTDSP